MSRLLRFPVAGHPYFITAVTHHRERILVDHGDLLVQALDEISRRCQFTLTSWVILPDHFHAIINPEGHDISNLLQRVKMSFGVLLRKRRGIMSGRVWQSRFWDHVIRDDEDMRRHIDYIHYNPVKHGYVMKPFDWRYSSIHEFESFYQSDWGERAPIQFEGEYGEWCPVGVSRKDNRQEPRLLPYWSAGFPAMTTGAFFSTRRRSRMKSFGAMQTACGRIR